MMIWILCAQDFVSVMKTNILICLGKLLWKDIVKTNLKCKLFFSRLFKAIIIIFLARSLF